MYWKLVIVGFLINDRIIHNSDKITIYYYTILNQACWKTFSTMKNKWKYTCKNFNAIGAHQNHYIFLYWIEILLTFAMGSCCKGSYILN